MFRIRSRDLLDAVYNDGRYAKKRSILLEESEEGKLECFNVNVHDYQFFMTIVLCT